MQTLLASQQHTDLVTHTLADDGIQWVFIPPGSPHWGGKWESAVRSVQLHLRRVVGTSMLIFEQMRTLLAQVSAVVNSRPLCYTPDTEVNYLSPAHFLIGRPFTTIPEADLGHITVGRLGYWQSIQSMYQGFWKQWHQEYLTTLQQRPKWTTSIPNISIGDVALFKESNSPPD
ncbi:GL16224 [Drosophila persimilis]|uniref:GL16224 n=1 Tax=Drosophila persimilis TaxID=7234 RepID=B4HBZ9_DROPE|nr:GL16224 [Drosophila persimilis]